jgi:hypothetical protein
MTANGVPVTTASYRNPHATLPIPLLTFLVVRNTSDEQIQENIRANSGRDLEWVGAREAHEGRAVIVGGGPSAGDYLEVIRNLWTDGGVVFAGNAASGFLGRFDIPVDYQVIGDAKPETATLVDEWAAHRLIASQVNPATLDRAIEAGRTTLWHLNAEGVEDLFPAERRKRGGYSLINGSSTVGDFMVRLAYVMGFRELHLFGFDSCHREGKSHAYSQPMNDSMPGTAVEWGGRTFYASLAMKAQAEKFQVTARKLKDAGCRLEVYGDGLLQAMYRTDPTTLSEKDLYRLMWQYDTYRVVAPGEDAVGTFMEVAKPVPGSMVIDFGCGTGRGSVALKKAGLNPLLVDFADNCRDMEAILLPFLEADLTQPIPLSAPYGFCTDVMEHIPTDDVGKVLTNILASAETVFFQISTVPDNMGALIGRPLHLTVRDHLWWRNWMEEVGTIEWERKDDLASLFLVKKDRQ